MAGSGSVGTLYRYELKMLLRDRRTILFSVVLPLVILPVFILIIRFTDTRAEERREARTYEYAVVGSEAELARDVIQEALGAPPDVAPPDLAARFTEVHPPDADSALMAGGIDLVVEGVSAVEVEGDVPVLRLRFRENRDPSREAASGLRSRLSALQRDHRHAVYREAGLLVEPNQIAAVELVGLATAERETGALLALWLTPLLIMLMLSGGSIVAADAISGEKERGTLETLLTTSVRRGEIVAAKQLLIITVGIAITVINVANIGLYLGLGLFELPERFVISVPPTAIVLLLLLFLPMTVLISSVLLMLSGVSKSYKEYQVYLFPVLVLFLLPSLTAILPGVTLASVLAVVPIANVSVAVREVMVGQYQWPFLALAILSTTAVAAGLARLTERTLSTEKLITAAQVDEADLAGGEALFRRRVLRWFALLWVALFLAALWLGGTLGIRGQIVFNIVGLFVGASLLMMWRYRLDPRQALALRMPRPAVWLAVLLGAPSAMIVGIGLAQAGQLIFPVPEQMIEAFGQYLLDDRLPLWQIIVFMAIIPGIGEEIAFRGVLLYGLRKRFRPIMLAVVVGLIFGAFHVELFRLIPTAYIGVLLTGVTLATGSIFPAMVWHALNNAAALVPTHLGWWDGDTALPLWAYALAAVGLAIAVVIIWRNRTPYPGLKS